MTLPAASVPSCPFNNISLVEATLRESLARVEIRSIEGNTENSSGFSIYMDTSIIIIEMVMLNDSRISITMAGTGIIMTTMMPTAITASSASLFFVSVRSTPLFVFDSAIIAAIKAFSPPPYPSPVKGEGIFNLLIAHCFPLIAFLANLSFSTYRRRQVSLLLPCKGLQGSHHRFLLSCIVFVPAAYSLQLLRCCSLRSLLSFQQSEEHTSELQSQSNIVCR